jgi:predicted Abi (CAAX) family protease
VRSGASVISRALRRLRASLVTWPDRRGWLFSTAIALGAVLAISAIGFGSGWLVLSPPVYGGLTRRVALMFVIPALGEEIIFRGGFVPSRSETAKPWGPIAISTIAYVAWHLVEGRFVLPGAAKVFFNPAFLGCASALGIACAILRWRTASLWPSVLLHWATVIVWQTWFGGFTPGF